MSKGKEVIDEFINDPELIEGFIAEAKEHLDTIEDDFLTLEKQKDKPDQELLNKVFRAIHSVKGAAGFMGLSNMSSLTHTMETLLSRMRSGEITPESEHIDTLLVGVDLLTTMLDDISLSNEVDITGVSENLSALLDRESTPSRPTKKQPVEPITEKAEETLLTAKNGLDFGNTIRINVDILDRLMVQVGELVLVRNQQLVSLDESGEVSRAIAHRLDLVTTELQETIISTRMQPIGKIFGKLPRVVRELGKKLGKQIEIAISGSEAELDKTILESLADPITHIIRNCCGHGIETPEERMRDGKPKSGCIWLSAYHEAGVVNIVVRDDGRGIDPKLIRKTLLDKKLKTEAELDQMSDKEIMHLIFISGFSTAGEASDVSGRGVGMDVVKTGIEKLGGSFDLESTVGEGTTIHLRLPLTLAIIPSLIVRVGENIFAIPQISLVELVCLYDEDVVRKIECEDDHEVYRLRDRLLPIVRLSEVLTRPTRFTREIRSEITEQYQKQQEKAWHDYRDAGGGHNGSRFMQALNFAVLKAGNNRFGLVVDEILGTEEIVVKPMHSAVKSLGIYSGATIMSNGKCTLILDAEGIARHSGITMESRIDKTADEMDKEVKGEEWQTVLLFKSGEEEQFAMGLPLIRRVEPISMSNIERVGEKEYITVDGTSTLVIRLDQVLNVTPVVEKEEMFLILPRHIKRPVGILISRLIDIEEIAAALDTGSYMEAGLLGTAIIRDTMTLFIDIHRMVEMVEPEWFAEQRTSQSGKLASPSGSAKQVLLLQHDSFFRHLIQGYLEEEGYRVTSAENGRIGLDCMDNNEFDLIVADLEMPVMDGWNFLTNVRRGTHQQDTPAVALTSLSTDKDRKKAMECGFDRYEVKLDREHLLTTVAELLGVEKR